MSKVIDSGNVIEEKSQDKLEIEVEEQILGEESNGGKVSNSESDTIINLSPKVAPAAKTKSRLSIKIPQIFQKRPEIVKLEDDDAAECQAGVTEKAVNGNGHVDDDKVNGDTFMVDMNGSSSASFLSGFSTPRWTNFRRVFSLNRSTPSPLAQEISLDEGLAPVVVAVDVPSKTNKEVQLDLETKTESTGGIDGNGKNPQEKSLILPIFRLFSKSRAIAAEPMNPEIVVETNGKIEEQVEREKTDHIEKPEEKCSEEESPPEQNSPLPSANGKSKTPLRWSDRLERISDRKKLAVSAVSGLVLLVAAAIVIVFCRANRAIDIGSLIIEGKYINTMTSCGPVQGTLEDGGYAFRGIPYAVPPLGERRWRPSQLHSHLSHCWNGTYQATKRALPCWQFYRNGNYDGTEDCLYLDVYTPKPYYDSPVPVVVYIGGESLNGGDSTTLQPSTKMAVRKSVVFVSIFVRRSVLGFLTVEPLSRNSYPMTSGNYGLSDLLTALHWVKLNIQHFGGDRHHVTVLGYQAGASLVMALFKTHLSKGLFHQVWISGGSPPNLLMTVQEAEIQNEEYLKDLGCTTIECLHNKGPEELLESVPNDWRIFQQDLPNRSEKRHHWLVSDGLILRDSFDSEHIPRTQLPPDDLAKIPFVAGAAAEVDASPEMYSYLNWNDTSKFSAYLESSLGSFGPSLPREVIDRYFRPESTPWQTFASLLSDVRTICPLYYASLARADAYVKLPVYFYVATQRKSTSIGFIAEAQTDIGAILGTYVAETRDEKKFVSNIQNLFYDFVEKGNLDEIQDVTKSIVKVDESIQKIYTYPNCDFWQEHHFFPSHSRVD